MDQSVIHSEILVALRRILRATELHSKHLSKVVHLTFPQLLLMRHLEKERQASAGQLADALSLSRATVTTIVDRLENRGLVTRERRTDDRRSINLQLTDSGRELLDHAPASLQDHFIQQLQGLEAWQQTQVLSVLQQVATMMNAGRLDAAPLLDIGAADRQTPEN